MGLCPQLKRKNSKNNYKDNRNSANLHEGYESAEVLVVTELDSKEQWILDSDCSFHMTPWKHYFTDLTEMEGGKVVMGNNQQCMVRGICNVKLQLDDGSVKLLKAIRFVPELKRNLISLGTLDSDGYHYKSENGILRVFKNDSLKLIGKLCSGLYVLQGKTLLGEVNTIEQQNKEGSLWHKRLAHISERRLSCLYKQGLIGDQKPDHIDFCEHCIIGKSARQSFKPAMHITKDKLEYVHSDLWGPARVTTHGGAM